VNMPSSWGKTPRESIEQECARRGKDAVVAGCIELLGGGESDAELILALGGPPARWVVTGAPSGPPYWLRVWATRGLLWAWDDAALQSIEVALNDDAWRVREMALKVVARHRLEDTVLTVIELQEDPAARVRAAASRALMRISARGECPPQ
jgi:HEAT repeats